MSEKLFQARLDILTVVDLAEVGWEINAKVVDVSGSFTANDVLVGDKVVIVGVSADSVTTYDRYVISEIIGHDVVYITFNMIFDEEGTPATYGGRPLTGAQSIGRAYGTDNSLMAMPSSHEIQDELRKDQALVNMNLKQLSENQPSGGSSSIELPLLSLRASNKATGTPLAYNVSDRLTAKWVSNNLNFLDYNPEIWAFRYNNYARRVKDLDLGGYLRKSRVKKWKHEPHLNGIKYPGSNRYSGNSTFACLVEAIRISGRKTEFTPTMANNTWFEIGFDCYDYVFGFDPLTAEYSVINDLTDFSVITPFLGNDVSSDKRGMIFRFAIVIDNPGYPLNSPDPKLIGPKSDMFQMKLNLYQPFSANNPTGINPCRITFQQFHQHVRWGV